MVDEIDALIAETRKLAAQLNTHLGELEAMGVKCYSVVGPPPEWEFNRGKAVEIARVSLVIEFKA